MKTFTAANRIFASSLGQDPRPDSGSGIGPAWSLATRTPSRRFSRLLGYLVANLLIVVVLYSNAAIIFNIPLSRIVPGRQLPIPPALFSAFHLFGVFSHFDTFNREIELYGELAPSESNPDGEIIRLTNSEFFAFHHGEVLSRVLVGENNLYTREQRMAAIQALAVRIRQRHNRLHPEQPIQKVVIAEATWPRSLVSYDFLKANATVDIHYAE